MSYYPVLHQIKPHMYCLPVLKHETDRQALLGAVKSGSKKFFMGTDSVSHWSCPAPMGRRARECGDAL